MQTFGSTYVFFWWGYDIIMLWVKSLRILAYVWVVEERTEKPQAEYLYIYL